MHLWPHQWRVYIIPSGYLLPFKNHNTLEWSDLSSFSSHSDQSYETRRTIGFVQFCIIFWIYDQTSISPTNHPVSQ